MTITQETVKELVNATDGLTELLRANKEDPNARVAAGELEDLRAEFTFDLNLRTPPSQEDLQRVYTGIARIADQYDAEDSWKYQGGK